MFKCKIYLYRLKKFVYSNSQCPPLLEPFQLIVICSLMFFISLATVDSEMKNTIAISFFVIFGFDLMAFTILRCLSDNIFKGVFWGSFWGSSITLYDFLLKTIWMKPPLSSYVGSGMSCCLQTTSANFLMKQLKNIQSKNSVAPTAL